MHYEYTSKLPIEDDPASELMSIQHALLVLGKQLDEEEQHGGAYLAQLLGKSVRAIAEKMDEERWEATREQPNNIHLIS